MERRKKILPADKGHRDLSFTTSTQSESGLSQRNARSSIFHSVDVSLKAVVSPVRVVIFKKLFAALMMRSNLLSEGRAFLIDKR